MKIFILKCLLCIVSVPLFLVVISGGFYGICYCMVNYSLIVFPGILLGLWGWAAVGLFKEWFN